MENSITLMVFILFNPSLRSIVFSRRYSCQLFLLIWSSTVAMIMVMRIRLKSLTSQHISPFYLFYYIHFNYKFLFQKTQVSMMERTLSMQSFTSDADAGQVQRKSREEFGVLSCPGRQQVIMNKLFNSAASMVSNALSRYTNKFVLL